MNKLEAKHAVNEILHGSNKYRMVDFEDRTDRKGDHICLKFQGPLLWTELHKLSELFQTDKIDVCSGHENPDPDNCPTCDTGSDWVELRIYEPKNCE